MNSKAIVLIALAIALLTIFVAPFRYVGHTGIVDQRPVSGTIHRALWDQPKQLDIEFLPVGAEGQDEPVFITASELDSAQLGLWWFGIALACVAVFFLTRRKEIR